MLYLVDGHNLIPRAGLSLEALDDEDQLIALLQEFCRKRHARVEVFFDGAPAGQAGSKRFGALTAHYVRKGSTADAAIERQLGKLGAQAKNLTVVSSDGRVQAAARAAHAGVLSSDDFAREISKSRTEGGASPEKESTPGEAEVEEWLKIFGKKKS